jgi:hypothetical protein
MVTTYFEKNNSLDYESKKDMYTYDRLVFLQSRVFHFDQDDPIYQDIN